MPTTLIKNGTVVTAADRYEADVLPRLLHLLERILVMAEGQIEAVGTHHELLAAGGRYAELFELQAAGYRP
jgi:ABC-type multidrug transport system fused ATPase/permease subunit